MDGIECNKTLPFDLIKLSILGRTFLLTPRFTCNDKSNNALPGFTNQSSMLPQAYTFLHQFNVNINRNTRYRHISVISNAWVPLKLTFQTSFSQRSKESVFIVLMALLRLLLHLLSLQKIIKARKIASFSKHVNMNKQWISFPKIFYRFVHYYSPSVSGWSRQWHN